MGCGRFPREIAVNRQRSRVSRHRPSSRLSFRWQARKGQRRQRTAWAIGLCVGKSARTLGKSCLQKGENSFPNAQLGNEHPARGSSKAESVTERAMGCASALRQPIGGDPAPPLPRPRLTCGADSPIESYSSLSAEWFRPGETSGGPKFFAKAIGAYGACGTESI